MQYIRNGLTIQHSDEMETPSSPLKMTNKTLLHNKLLTVWLMVPSHSAVNKYSLNITQ